MYSKPYCPYCVKAKELLGKKRLGFTDIDISADDEKRMEMFRRSGKVSVPQIFFDERHIGGFDDLNELDEKGELDKIKID